ncbi:MAG: Cys-tRNA(Pro) deacylase [Sphaerochaeta sp.]|jgi:Cys-tRNA(Pro)/Cys-tRNA(Cys) deacylase|uniref:Cys-tRNA(Pro) deacylase n=1 Tax=unclassified Sphaerochaeta TaxID=2637943 RepID=UPI000AD55474|nr:MULTISPECIES: Cys-tRNA(Pro) deacylase [unclassified Sphaerochaeta]MDX9825417.1 Cys-tRNA(Pro) deacylase [Sphaerochaeta sp.]HAP57446.1 Cys-tRNA(Pro) deacylase [Sphaerochaeta sp.]HBO36936.1 Cys-tRNA(Pro) deacylase [Sphaerochaeta sp.]HPE93726.1 Cys-tRNA(Pro) deacylase [Sphaerochaeta sp.]
MKKTNAMRILESMGIEYEVLSYDWDEEHLDAVHASQTAGLLPQQVFKTIVMQDDSKNVYVFCLPADFSVSLKKARTLTGSKDIDLIKLTQLQDLTGYVRGGCSPLGMKKHYPTFVEELAQLEEYIFVSAGQRGLQLKLRPEDLVRAANATFADFT